MRPKKSNAQGEGELFFEPSDFLALLEKERKWFDLLDTLRHVRWQRNWPEEGPEGQAVIPMLQDRARCMRNELGATVNRQVNRRPPRTTRQDGLICSASKTCNPITRASQTHCQYADYNGRRYETHRALAVRL
jgi:hypothetical protein